ncbi:MAG TPA: GNAT family N-acetyltransferase [Sphingomonas sp.]|nr:GNAT family N-acetyltransferase [Sphingomonas sp.]
MLSAAPALPSAVEVVPPEHLHDLRDEWAALWEAVPDASPFLHPAWLLAWERVYAPGQTWAVVLRADDELAALLPMFAWRGALLLAGTGPSDHGGLLARPEAANAVSALLGTVARCEAVGTIDLQQIEPGSPLARVILPAWEATSRPGDCCPMLPLAGTDGMDAVPKRMRANWRYARRRFEREGGVVEPVPADEAPAAVAALERLHGERWAEKGETGMFADDLLRRLLRRAAPALAEASALRLHRAVLGGETIAVLLTLHGRGRACYYLSGFDPNHARLSPGTLLVGAAIAAAADEGTQRFDFLRGREPYKYAWGAHDEPRVRRTFTPAPDK